MTDRLPPLPDAALSPQQRAAAATIAAGPRGGLYGPFVPLLRSPELMEHTQRLGEYLRYRSAVGARLSELVILVVARHWAQAVEWRRRPAGSLRLLHPAGDGHERRPDRGAAGRPSESVRVTHAVPAACGGGIWNTSRM